MQESTIPRTGQTPTSCGVFGGAWSLDLERVTLMLRCYKVGYAGRPDGSHKRYCRGLRNALRRYLRRHMVGYAGHRYGAGKTWLQWIWNALA